MRAPTQGGGVGRKVSHLPSNVAVSDIQLWPDFDLFDVSIVSSSLNFLLLHVSDFNEIVTLGVRQFRRSAELNAARLARTS